MDPNKIFQNIAIKIRPIQLKIELILISLIIIGVLLKSTEIGNILIVISFSSLSILYFIMAFRLISPENKTAIFLNKLIQISFSVIMMGILFAIQHYVGADMMLRIAIITMFIGLVFTFINKLNNNQSLNIIDSDTIRIIIITVVITSLIIFENNDISNHKENYNNQEIIEQE